jgi:hypothetical protein
MRRDVAGRKYYQRSSDQPGKAYVKSIGIPKELEEGAWWNEDHREPTADERDLARLNEQVPVGSGKNEVWDENRARVQFTVRNRKLIGSYSLTIISAVEEVLAYDQRRHHNQAPPPLWIDNPDYLKELRELVAQLKRLNNILEKGKVEIVDANTAVFNVGKRADIFFNNYSESFAKAAGKGTWYLLVGSTAALLYSAGAGHEIIDRVLSVLRK